MYIYIYIYIDTDLCIDIYIYILIYFVYFVYYNRQSRRRRRRPFRRPARRPSHPRPSSVRPFRRSRSVVVVHCPSVRPVGPFLRRRQSPVRPSRRRPSPVRPSRHPSCRCPSSVQMTVRQYDSTIVRVNNIQKLQEILHISYGIYIYCKVKI